MRRQLLGSTVILIAGLVAASPARAQYRGYAAGRPATGDDYRIEGTIGFWNPTPGIRVTSESLGIPGDEIDAVTDLGFAKTRFPDFRLALKPARKHKFRFSYIPIKYTAEAILTRTFVFNGIEYKVGLPVNSELDWKAYRFGYEYDFIYRERGFAGFIIDVKYTDARVELNSPIDSEWARARAPIPTIGGIGRVYVVPNVSVTVEVTGFKLPERIDEDYRGRYVDFDIYGMVNFNRNFGAQAGYRSIDVGYTVKRDTGHFKVNGLYFSGVARF